MNGHVAYLGHRWALINAPIISPHIHQLILFIGCFSPAHLPFSGGPFEPICGWFHFHLKFDDFRLGAEINWFWQSDDVKNHSFCFPSLSSTYMSCFHMGMKIVLNFWNINPILTLGWWRTVWFLHTRRLYNSLQFFLILKIHTMTFFRADIMKWHP